MKKRKKYVAIMCAALLAFSSLLQGCGKTETVSENSTKEVLSESSSPVGLDTLAATTGEDAVTIEDVYEPYLMQLGFLMRTPRGRMCTPAAWEHMKRTPPGQGNDNQLKMEL